MSPSFCARIRTTFTAALPLALYTWDEFPRGGHCRPSRVERDDRVRAHL
jgi:hypothetical protein